MTDEQQIRALIQTWASAAHEGDLDGVLADHAPEIVMIDVPPPYPGLRGLEAYRDSWPGFFAWQAKPAEFARDPEQRLRLTVGLRKTEGRWTVVHEHHSFCDTTPAPSQESR